MGSTVDNKNEGVVNPFYRTLEMVVEPRLEVADFGGTTSNWFTVAAPMQIVGMEIAYLEGYENPMTITYEPFNRDAICWRIRHVFGVGFMDWRGFQRNAGA